MRAPMLSACLAALLLSPTASWAAQPLSPKESNPVTLKMMTGFPPSAEHLVTQANMLRFPQSRWAFHHIRDLVPTVNVWAGPEDNVAELDSEPYPVRDITFTGPDGKTLTVGDWLDSTYTDGFIVLHDGDVAYEYYTQGMQPHVPHLMMSDTKSVTGLLAADLIARGKLDPSALVTEYIPELKGSAWEGATVQQTLDMTTAIRFNERYGDPTSDIYRYAIAAGMVEAPDGYKGPVAMYDYLPTLEKNGKHGEHFTYRTVNPEVIAWIIQHVTGKDLQTLLSEQIWQPMGAEEDAYYIADAHGAPQAGGGMSATLRDMARFADMVRLRGEYNGKTILDPQAFDHVFTESYPVTLPEDHYPGGRKGYSYHNFWWLTNNAHGAVEAWGIFGQIVHIDPVTGVVIVKQSSRPKAGNGPYSAMATRAFTAISAALAEQHDD